MRRHPDDRWRSAQRPLHRAGRRRRDRVVPDERRAASRLRRPAALAGHRRRRADRRASSRRPCNRLGVEVTHGAARATLPLRGEEPEARETLVARCCAHEGVARRHRRRRSGARDDRPAAAELYWDGGSADGEHVLLATGREPRVDDLRPRRGGHRAGRGRARASTSTSRRPRPASGRIGDAIGGDHRRFQFTHVATYEGPQVAENALRGTAHRPRLRRDAARHVHRPRGGRRSGSPRPRRASAATTCTRTCKLVRELGKARAMGEQRGLREGRDRRRDAASWSAPRSWPRTRGDMLATLTTPLHIARRRPRRRCSPRRSRTRR